MCYKEVIVLCFQVETLTKNTNTLSWVNTWILESPVDDADDQTWGKYGHL